MLKKSEVMSERGGRECAWIPPLGAIRPLGEGIKGEAVCFLTQKCLPFLYRAKYFQGKKVNGEIEIRVEQVGWSGVFIAVTLTFSIAGAVPRSSRRPSFYVGLMNQNYQKNPGLYLGVSLNCRII